MTQLRFRLGEGAGECFYYIGVHDDGNLVGLPESDLAASLETLHAMAAEAGAKASLVRRLAGAGGRHCAIMRLVRTTVRRLSCTDLRIAGAGVPVLLLYIESSRIGPVNRIRIFHYLLFAVNS